MTCHLGWVELWTLQRYFTDIHHTMGKKGHPPYQTPTTPWVKYDIHHTRHPPHQTFTTSDIHHTRHSPHQTSTTPDIHHTMCKKGHPPHQTSTTLDIRLGLIAPSSYSKPLPVIFLLLLVYHLRKHFSLSISDWFWGVCNFQNLKILSIQSNFKIVADVWCDLSKLGREGH